MAVTRLSRRSLLQAAGATTALGAAPWTTARTVTQPAAATAPGSLTDVGGVRVGHFTDPRRPTGCTVILFDKPATAGVDYDGSAPGESLGVMLQPVSPLDHIHGLLLTGGGPMALGATAGVSASSRNDGSATTGVCPTSASPSWSARSSTISRSAMAAFASVPTRRIARARRRRRPRCAEGSVGAGTGATVGKMFVGRGLRGMKGGVGGASARLGDVVVSALVVVNAAGDIFDWRQGTIVAGARTADGRDFADTRRRAAPRSRDRRAPPARSPITPFRATTLTVVATNVALNKTQLSKLAMMVNTGPARAIHPYHTQGDGDQVLDLLHRRGRPRRSRSPRWARSGPSLAADAIGRAVRAATSVPGWVAVRDL